MRKNKPTEAELEILQILWERGQATVREVNESCSRIREVGYTTTLKLMQIMTDKGLLSRRKNGKSHVYKTRYSQSDTQKKNGGPSATNGISGIGYEPGVASAGE